MSEILGKQNEMVSLKSMKISVHGSFADNSALLPSPFLYVGFLEVFGGKHFSCQNGKSGSEILCTNWLVKLHYYSRQSKCPF